MKKLNLGRFFDDRRILMIVSFLLAVISWLVVAYAIDPNTRVEIKDVPVDVTAQQAETLDLIGLKIVDGATAKVSVLISGERYIIGGVNPSDISVTANLSGITAAGTYNKISLTATDKYGKGFDVVKISPEYITLKIDRPVTKKFVLKTDIEGLQIPDDYLISDTKVSPKEVTITGPEVDVNKIDKCIVSAKFTEPLTATTTKMSEIKLYDSEGTELSKDLLTLDNDTADITVTVLKQKRVSLKFEFNRIPSGFPIEQLDYHFMEQGDLLIAGPEAAVDGFKEKDLGFVNINEIRVGGFVQTFDVDLPDDFLNVDQVKQVDVLFDTQDMVEAKFTVKNIKVTNVPANYEASVTTSQITDVNIVGDPEVMAALSADDIVAEIDLSSREITSGPSNLPVRISVPGRKLAWATGEYTAVISIKEKE